MEMPAKVLKTVFVIDSTTEGAQDHSHKLKATLQRFLVFNISQHYTIYIYICVGVSVKNNSHDAKTLIAEIFCHRSDVPVRSSYLVCTRLDPFGCRTAIILHGIDLTRCWKQFSDILVCSCNNLLAAYLFHHIPKALHWTEIC